MAYFSNATEAEIAMENCYICRNWKLRGDNEVESCPIIDAHYRVNYEQCKKKYVKMILEILWPSDEKGFPAECSMFEPNGDCRGQLSMTFNSLPK